MVRYKKGIRRITLTRLILSRIAYVRTRKQVTLDEILILYDNLLYLQILASRDQSFSLKYGSALEALSLLLQRINLRKLGIKQAWQILVRGIEYFPERKFLIPERNLLQVERNMRGSYWFLLTRTPGILKRQTQPKRWIGVGYRDKGTRRDVAWDGSPSWQEVAMSLKVEEI